MVVQSETQGQVQEFVAVLSKRRWQVVLPALFVLAFGFVFATIVPKKYVVNAEIELLEPRGSGPGQIASAREVQNAPLHLRNYARVRSVIERQNWVEYNHLNNQDRHAFIESVLGNIDVLVRGKKNTEGSTFVWISYADVEARRAEKFLNELLRRWIDDVIERDKDRLMAEREEYQNQLQMAKAEHSLLTKQHTELLSEMELSATQPTNMRTQREEDPVYQQWTTAKEERERLAAELAGERKRLEAMRAEYQQLDLEIPYEQVEEKVDLSQQIAERQLLIDGIRSKVSGYTPQHSQRRRAEIEIAKLEAGIEKAESLQRDAQKRTSWVPNPEREKLGQAVKTLEYELSALEAEHDQWRKEADTKQTEHQAQLVDWAELTKLDRAKEIASEAVGEAGGKLRTVQSQLNVLLHAEGDPYRITREPIAPPKPTEPNPMVIIVFSAIGGLAFGLLVAFLAEFGRSSYRNVQELTRVMGVPVLGVINAIVTHSEQRRQRVQRLLVGVSSSVILLGLAWFSWAWAYHPEQLPTGVVRVVEDFQLKLR
ncbi:MAG: hypothetical protein O7B99_16220 [Planctomycetota bacterium]|nr:hypothetical protein [Planctomycetota bacterium]